MYWMTLPLKRYFEFSGRSRRKEYWMFFLFTVICNVVLSILDGALGLTLGDDEATSISNTGVLAGLFGLATFIPSISVGVRRLHDTNRRGWWLLFPVLTLIVGGLLTGVLVSGVSSDSSGLAGLGGAVLGLALGALIGFVTLLVFYVMDGTPGPNRFGDDPKDPVGDVADVFR